MLAWRNKLSSLDKCSPELACWPRTEVGLFERADSRDCDGNRRRQVESESEREKE